ncbi:hypothetical protein C2142_01860 [Streptomyces sp. CB01881]|nr:hypothetical protein C2142_01860 [Streptomyces sp. CB01881]
MLAVLAPAGTSSSPASPPAATTTPARTSPRPSPEHTTLSATKEPALPPHHAVVLVLLWAGVACMLLSAAALVRLRGTLMRLHALAPASVAGVPLIAAAVAVDQGAGRAAAKTLFIGLLFAAGGTATAIAGWTERDVDGVDGRVASVEGMVVLGTRPGRPRARSRPRSLRPDTALWPGSQSSRWAARCGRGTHLMDHQ